MTLRRLAGDTLIYGSGYILGKVLNYLLITAYLTRKFVGEEEQYGLYTDFYFYVALLLIILTLRMETTFFRFASEKGRFNTIYTQASFMLMGSAALWLLLVSAFKTDIAAFLQYPGYETHVLILGIIIALDVLVAIPFASLRLEQRPIMFAALKVGGILLNILAVLFFLEVLPRMASGGSGWAADFYNPDHRLLYVFVANLMASAVVFLTFLPRYFRLRPDWSERYFVPMLKYTLPLVVVGIAGVINQSSYITFQKFILPNSLTQNLAEGGVYAAATRIAILMSLFITAFNYAAEPFFFQESKNKQHKSVYADVATAFAIAGSILMVGIVLYLDVIQLLLGSSFRESIHFVPILLSAFFLLGLYYNFSIWYKLTDKTLLGAFISLGGAAFTIGLNLYLIPKIGVGGSAIAALSCYGFMTIACYLLGQKYYPVPYKLMEIAPLAIAGPLFYQLSEWIRAWTGASVGIMLLINTLLFAAFVWMVYSRHRHMILSVLRRNYKPGP